jgi:hypothetical protein
VSEKEKAKNRGNQRKKVLSDADDEGAVIVTRRTTISKDHKEKIAKDYPRILLRLCRTIRGVCVKVDLRIAPVGPYVILAAHHFRTSSVTICNDERPSS